jgi:methylmalonyl-CoA mutase, N-terminal domain
LKTWKEELFRGIDLEKVSTSMTINATAFILLGLYIALAKRQGADVKKLSGTVQNDILKEYAARGTYIYPPKPSMRIITDIFDYCSKEVPLWNTISVSGYHIREAGSDAAQELAFSLADGKAYVQAAKAVGLDINVSISTCLQSGFPSSSTRTTTCLKKWQSFVQQEGCGPTSPSR